MSEITEKILNIITEETEQNFIDALREYYRQSFRNGKSDEAFLLWIEGAINANAE